MKNFSKLPKDKKNIYRKLFSPFAKFLIKNINSLFSLWEDLGLHITPNHFYSPIPDTRFLNENRVKIFNTNCLNFNEKNQLKFLKKIKKYNFEFINSINKNETKFYFGNGLYDFIDAILLFSIIRNIKPKKIIEIGSGFSTLISSIAGQFNGNIEIVCIDPLSKFKKNEIFGLTDIIKKPVEDISLDFFKNLSKNDILFVDSSHTVKVNSDVIFLILEVLPNLKDNVYIHFHDIFLPLDYPTYWIKEEKRFWNEQYLLHSFLCFNKKFEIFFATSYMGLKYNKLMKETFVFPEKFKKELEITYKKLFPEINWWGGGSFWIKKMK